MKSFYFFLIFNICLSLFTNAQTNQFDFQAHHKDDITVIEYSPDGKYIISGSWDESIIIQRNDSTKEVVQRIHDNKGAITSISFRRDGYHMITGSQSGKLNIYHFNDSFFSVATLDTTLLVNQCQINKLIYGPSMRTIFSAGDDGRFITFDLTRNQIIPIKTPRPISAAGISIDRMSYFIAHENETEIIRYDITGRKLKSYLGHTNQITDILVTIDRKHIISSSEDKTVRIWDIRSGKELFSFKDHRWTVTDIATDPRGKYLVSGSLDGTVNLYHLKDKQFIKSYNLEGYKVNALAFSPNYTKIAVAAQKNEPSEFAGYFIVETDLKYRPVKLPKRYKDKKQTKQMKSNSATKNQTPSSVKRTNNSSKVGLNTNNIKPKSNEKVIKKTDQIEIRID
tara:strand:+ start:74 stop:1261 length:1188 start_codon:yes stop_codon:yes gene_type:complete